MSADRADAAPVDGALVATAPVDAALIDVALVRTVVAKQFPE